jgi:hypothetical protein
MYANACPMPASNSPNEALGCTFRLNWFPVTRSMSPFIHTSSTTRRTPARRIANKSSRPALSIPVSCLKSISIFMRALTRLVRYFPSSAQGTVETYQSCIDLGVDIYKLALALQ